MHIEAYLLTLLKLLFLLLLFIIYRLSRKAGKIEYEFTSIVNHTFRTPLTRINWISKELEKDLPTNERMQYLQNLNNATNKLLEIVDLIAGVKDIKNTSGYNFVATSIRDVVEGSITKYREEINKKNITFHVPTFKEIPLLTIDLKKISFVIDSILENAIVYTSKDGKIFIDTVLKPHSIVFYVGDSGIGLSFYDKHRIFTKFFRSQAAVLAYPDGTGLKLYLVKQIVQRHKGKISAKSNGKNKGTTLILELPFQKN